MMILSTKESFIYCNIGLLPYSSRKKDPRGKGQLLKTHKKYRSKTRPEVAPAEYIVVKPNEDIKKGFSLLAPGAPIAVKDLWLHSVLATISRKRGGDYKKHRKKGREYKSDERSEILKKLMDAFYEPWELAKMKGTLSCTGEPIYESLKYSDDDFQQEPANNRFVGAMVDLYTIRTNKRGPKPRNIRLKLYLLPAGSRLPKFSRQDPLIATHQSQGFGYPATLYTSPIAKKASFSIHLSTEEFKNAIREFYPRLQDEDFNLSIIDNNRRLTVVPTDTRYFKHIKYQGTTVIQITLR